MPADYERMAEAFADLTGHYYPQETWYSQPGDVFEASGYQGWIDLFQETGLDFEDPRDTTEAFENFLIAFYPQEGMNGDDWRGIRQEFFDMYGVDDHSIDWEAYREAIGYGYT